MNLLLYYCPFCDANHAEPCVHLKKVLYDQHGNMTGIEFRSIKDIFHVDGVDRTREMARRCRLPAEDRWPRKASEDGK